MKVSSRVLLILLGTVCLCCKKEAVSGNNDDEIRSRYYNLEKIGWKSKIFIQEVDDINFSAIEVPIQYYLLKDKGKEDIAFVDSLYEENKTERIYEFTFKHDDGKDLLSDKFTGMPFDDAVKYLSFGLEKDFYVVTAKNDTVRCSGVTYERSYKIAPYQRALLFFTGIDPNDTLQLVYTDRLFRKGTLKFRFKDTYTQIAL